MIDRFLDGIYHVLSDFESLLEVHEEGSGASLLRLSSFSLRFRHPSNCLLSLLTNSYNGSPLLSALSGWSQLFITT